ncbi:MAG: gamma carbonic anhydrase family protein [Syntrophales bacterium]|nr:gamma carbonic anhydrase family protein [Syntrophales bacterium]
MSIYELDGKRPYISPDAFVHPRAVIIGEATIGSGCYIAPGAVIRADFAPITVGDGTSIQDNAVLHVSPGDGIVIGRNVIIAHLAVLHDVTIRDRCVIGMGAVLAHRVFCEDGVVVGAGSVVTRDTHIPAGKLAVGNPAKVIKAVDPELTAYMAAGVEKYKNLARLYRETLKEI